MHALYIIGAPGVGKSTLMAALTAPFESLREPVDKPFAHIRYPGGIELGARREAFSGTDALSMSVQPLVVDFLANTRPERVIGEGDRLANESFFTALKRMGYKLTVIYLEASPATLAARRAGRGSHQNEAWMRGRETKARKLANNWAQGWMDVEGGIETIVEIMSGYEAMKLG